MLRLLLSTVLLTGFVLSQLPSLAECQMSLGLAVGCHMPCCKKIPMKNCPDLKTRAPRDVISTASISFDAGLLKILYFLTPTLSLEKPLTLFARVYDYTLPLRTFLFASPVQGRAPPADSQLLAA